LLGRANLLVTSPPAKDHRMPRHIFDSEVTATIAAAQAAGRARRTRAVSVDGETLSVRWPFPSPGDWRDHWIYFLLLDRFSNPTSAPRGDWNRRVDFRQGGTFKGVQARLGYLQQLGVGTIWLSPVLKNARPDWQYNYHGYGQQDFLNLDERFASDGQLATAERELVELIEEAHARGLYVVLDIVLNHCARVFDYVRPEGVVAGFGDAAVMEGGLGSEPAVQWLNGLGFPRAEWQNALPAPDQLHADDAIWPADFQNHEFFRRRGSKLTDAPEGHGFVRGDFGDMRQLAVEYDASVAGQESLRASYGVSPVLAILIRAHEYLIAKYDFDGFRLDTVKYVHPEAIETFGNAMREFALTLGKHNFFTFGEVYDDESVIARFIGRNGGDGEGFGIDAALDFPLFFKVPAVAKGQLNVAEIRRVFADRKRQEKELLSSHGEAGRFFVSFLDNHDQKERIQHPLTPQAQVSLAIALLFTLQGIPALYYGTEQGLSGTIDASGRPDLSANESSREALWGKTDAFDITAARFREIRALSKLRVDEPALRYGRMYFRETSGNGADFGHSEGAGGIVAFSRILADREILIVANTGSLAFAGSVIIDRDLHKVSHHLRIAYSNLATVGTAAVRHVPLATFHAPTGISRGLAAMVDVSLAPAETQILVPV
jgi:glycosidase